MYFVFLLNKKPKWDYMGYCIIMGWFSPSSWIKEEWIESHPLMRKTILSVQLDHVSIPIFFGYISTFSHKPPPTSVGKLVPQKLNPNIFNQILLSPNFSESNHHSGKCFRTGICERPKPISSWGYMVMFSDFSLKALIASWNSVARQRFKSGDWSRLELTTSPKPRVYEGFFKGEPYQKRFINISKLEVVQPRFSGNSGGNMTTYQPKHHDFKGWMFGGTGLLRSPALSTDGRLQRSDPIELWSWNAATR